MLKKLGILPFLLLLMVKPALAAKCVTLSAPAIGGGNEICTDAPGGIIYAYILLVVNFVLAPFLAIVVLMVVWSGYEYIISAGDPQKAKHARDRILQIVLSVIAYAGMKIFLETILL